MEARLLCQDFKKRSILSRRMSFTFYHLGAHQGMIHLFPSTGLTLNKLAKSARSVHAVRPSSGLIDLFLSMNMQRSLSGRASGLKKRHQGGQMQNMILEETNIMQRTGGNLNSSVHSQRDLGKCCNMQQAFSSENGISTHQEIPPR